MRVASLILAFAVFATTSFAQSGDIPADPIFGDANALAYRMMPSGRFEVVLGGLVARTPNPTKTKIPTTVCFMFGSSTRPPDPRRGVCAGARELKFEPPSPVRTSWQTLTNVGCIPSSISNGHGKGCEAVHVYAVNSATTPVSYTRLTDLKGAPVFFNSSGQDSRDQSPPFISSVRYEPSSQTNSTSIRTTGFVRVIGGNFKLNKRYSMLIDGVPYASGTSVTVSNIPTIPPVGEHYVDFPGFSLPVGEYSIQLAEFIREPRSGDGDNLYANAIKPYSSAVGKLFVARGAVGVSCSTIPEQLGRVNPQCFMLKGFLSRPQAVTPCSDTSNNRTCIRNFPDSKDTITSVDVITTRVGARIRNFGCYLLFSGFHCFADVGAR